MHPLDQRRARIATGQRLRNTLDEHTRYPSWRDYAISRLVRFAIISTLLILVMNFGFWRAYPLPARIVFWMASVALGLAAYEAMRFIILRWVKSRWFGVEDIYLVPHLYLPLIIVPGAVPTTIGMHLLFDLLLRRPDMPVQPMIYSYLQIVVVALALSMGGVYLRLFFGVAGMKKYAFETEFENEDGAAGAEIAGGPPAFMSRVAPAKRGALVALQSEDHYLRVHTENGSDLIRYRLADAIAELQPESGRQVHRSWWVANEAVTGARQEDRRAVVLTRSGLEVPVSRSYLPEIRAAGWL